MFAGLSLMRMVSWGASLHPASLARAVEVRATLKHRYVEIVLEPGVKRLSVPESREWWLRSIVLS
jgi:hypothetical protein